MSDPLGATLLVSSPLGETPSFATLALCGADRVNFARRLTGQGLFHALLIVEPRQNGAECYLGRLSAP
jgi:hypothetical protein